MAAVLVLILVFVVIQIPILGAGVSIGLLLHWWIPSMSIGTGILAGTISAATAMHVLLRVLMPLGLLPSWDSIRPIDEEEEDAEDDDESDWSEPMVSRRPSKPSTSRRSRRKRRQ